MDAPELEEAAHRAALARLAHAAAEQPTGTYEGDAARKEIAVILEEYQKKAWEAREAKRNGK